MFSFCANFSYFTPMPMYMPFGSLCCGGNSFWGSFLGGFLGSSLANGGRFSYQQPYYDNNFSYGGYGAYNQPLFNSGMMPMSTMVMPSLSMPQANFSNTLNFNYVSNNNYMYSPFAAMPAQAAAVTAGGSGIESFNPFSYKPETKKESGTRFDSDRYIKGRNTTSSVKFNTKTNLPQLKSVGYSEDKGRRLAEEALSHATGFSGNCGVYVRRALERSHLANGKRTGSAADFGDVLLKQKNFKEISTNGLDLSSLPAGCVLVYGRGVSGYSDKDGHVEITIGDGRAASDGITKNIRKGARVFVPVKA